MRLLILAVAALCPCPAAQSPAALFEKAPPHVEEALRSRITLFYQAHMDGKPRRADQVVAEDSKDAFFEAEKPRYLSYEIVTVKYSDSFTRATALVNCETDVLMQAMGRMRIKRPITSLWRIVDGQWFWYVMPIDPKVGQDTPFGRMRTSPEGPGAPSPPPSQITLPSMQEILKKVRVSKNDVMLSSYQASSDEVIVYNDMPGTVTVSLDPAFAPGLQVKLDRTELKAGETARVTFQYQPPDKQPKPTLTATVRVQPTTQAFPIQIQFAVPPEIQKLLPKQPSQQPTP